jgi:hypothetical protein
MGKVLIERKFEKNSDGFSFYHIRKWKDLNTIIYLALNYARLCLKKGLMNGKWLV